MTPTPRSPGGMRWRPGRKQRTGYVTQPSYTAFPWVMQSSRLLIKELQKPDKKNPTNDNHCGTFRKLPLGFVWRTLHWYRYKHTAVIYPFKRKWVVRFQFIILNRRQLFPKSYVTDRRCIFTIAISTNISPYENTTENTDLILIILHASWKGENLSVFYPELQTRDH